MKHDKNTIKDLTEKVDTSDKRVEQVIDEFDKKSRLARKRRQEEKIIWVERESQSGMLIERLKAEKENYSMNLDDLRQKKDEIWSKLINAEKESRTFKFQLKNVTAQMSSSGSCSNLETLQDKLKGQEVKCLKAELEEYNNCNAIALAHKDQQIKSLKQNLDQLSMTTRQELLEKDIKIQHLNDELTKWSRHFDGFLANKGEAVNHMYDNLVYMMYDEVESLVLEKHLGIPYCREESQPTGSVDAGLTSINTKRERLPLRTRNQKDGVYVPRSGDQKGVPVRRSRDHKEGLPGRRSEDQKEGVPVRRSGDKKEGLPVQRSGDQKNGLPLRALAAQKERQLLRKSCDQKNGQPLPTPADQKEEPLRRSGDQKDRQPLRKSGDLQDKPPLETSADQMDRLPLRRSSDQQNKEQDIKDIKEQALVVPKTMEVRDPGRITSGKCP